MVLTPGFLGQAGVASPTPEIGEKETGSNRIPASDNGLISQICVAPRLNLARLYKTKAAGQIGTMVGGRLGAQGRSRIVLAAKCGLSRDAMSLAVTEFIALVVRPKCQAILRRWHLFVVPGLRALSFGCQCTGFRG